MKSCNMKKSVEVIKGSNGKQMLMDITFPEKSNNKLVIFSHGFKGFKDWGCFDLLAQNFVEKGFTFLKFNFSHNGTTVSDPLNFTDLEAFGNNNFSKELNDLGFVLDWVENNLSIYDVSLLGHSRGGGISMLKSGEDKRVTRVISWASPSSFLNRMPQDRIEIWKEKGVAFVYNGRTKQNMPLYLQFYTDCMENKDRLNIEKSVSSLKIPHLIIHGDSDPTVDIKEAEDLHSWNPNSKFIVFKDADHVFGGCHPFSENVLPHFLQRAVDDTIDFIQ